MLEQSNPQPPYIGRAHIPLLGDQIPQRGNWLTKTIGRLILTIFGWHFAGPLPNQAKFIAIGAPHTSNWDYPLAAIAIWALGVDVTIMAKHTMFRKPYGWLFRWLGLIPIDRTAHHGVVEQLAAEFSRRDKLLLGLAPEGTRSKVKRWKTGFYHIAVQAGVPILPVALDFGRKTIRFHELLFPTGNLEDDLQKLKEIYADATGRNPELGIVG
ncbi:MAG: lysophospholipid acyltransferase family protein [Anaerolineales bacterium]|nr:lysophospholipid acyltransferase family protein [Anaerolineales bacterium]